MSKWLGIAYKNIEHANSIKEKTSRAWLGYDVTKYYLMLALIHAILDVASAIRENGTAG